MPTAVVKARGTGIIAWKTYQVGDSVEVSGGSDAFGATVSKVKRFEIILITPFFARIHHRRRGSAGARGLRHAACCSVLIGVLPVSLCSHWAFQVGKGEGAYKDRKGLSVV